MRKTQARVQASGGMPAFWLHKFRTCTSLRSSQAALAAGIVAAFLFQASTSASASPPPPHSTGLTVCAQRFAGRAPHPHQRPRRRAAGHSTCLQAGGTGSTVRPMSSLPTVLDAPEHYPPRYTVIAVAVPRHIANRTRSSSSTASHILIR